jgi:aminoglycoside phosphotransferase (APT) family kinase protein
MSGDDQKAEEKLAVDPARAVRPGEEIDLEKLRVYLSAHLDSGAPGVKQISLEQFPGGHSNLTYLLHVDGRELILRRPPFGNRVKSAHDMTREVTMLSALSPVYPQAPKPLVNCEDASVIGSPFYVMERIRGVILRRTLPKGVTVSPGEACRLSEAFVDNLVTLHAIDWEKIGLNAIAKPEGYVTRQVTGWMKRYQDAATDDIPNMDQVGKWLTEKMPKTDGAAERKNATVIHNDYKFDNLVLAPDNVGSILGVLDWEMSTVGDPLMDLGTALGYWVEATDGEDIRSFAFGPTALPGSFTRREIAERYSAKSGRDTSHMLFYFVFSLYKTAGVAQQIYWRFKMGHTKDERFGAFLFGVQILAQSAARAIERGHI